MPHFTHKKGMPSYLWNISPMKFSDWNRVLWHPTVADEDEHQQRIVIFMTELRMRRDIVLAFV